MKKIFLTLLLTFIFSDVFSQEIKTEKHQLRLYTAMTMPIKLKVNSIGAKYLEGKTRLRPSFGLSYHYSINEKWNFMTGVEVSELQTFYIDNGAYNNPTFNPSLITWGTYLGYQLSIPMGAEYVFYETKRKKYLQA